MLALLVPVPVVFRTESIVRPVATEERQVERPEVAAEPSPRRKLAPALVAVPITVVTTAGRVFFGPARICNAAACASAAAGVVRRRIAGRRRAGLRHRQQPV